VNGAGKIKKVLLIFGALAAPGRGQVLQRNKRTWPETKRMSDEVRVGSVQERGPRRPDAFSYGLWA
jgi:hypothetical protein